jgi:hypothetical protein
MFLAYNNGIVATVDDLEIVNDKAGRPSIKSLKGLQIVNGGQTTASLHRARRKDSLNLGNVAVPVKIIKVGGADLRPERDGRFHLASGKPAEYRPAGGLLGQRSLPPADRDTREQHLAG